MSNKASERIGAKNLNNKGLEMTVVKYNNANDLIVEFNDGYSTHCAWKEFKNGAVLYRPYRIGMINKNSEGFNMKIILCNNSNDIYVEFQDEHKSVVHCSWKAFKSGGVKNPYAKSVYGVGSVGVKYPSWVNGKHTKEYKAWIRMLERCYGENQLRDNPWYVGCSVCEEWLIFENFYDWIHSQENFDRWSKNKFWAIDKDIINKGNKIYSSNTCCLVPPNINSLFVKDDASRGKFYIGVSYDRQANMYFAQCSNPITNKNIHLGFYDNQEDAFYAYKNYKEKLIKEIAKKEYDNGNITKKYYDAMIDHQVEITD